MLYNNSNKRKKNVAVSFVKPRSFLTNHEMINKSDKASGLHLYYYIGRRRQGIALDSVERSGIVRFSIRL